MPNDRGNDLRFAALLLVLAGCAGGTLSCGGGQSGNEDDLPAAPCASNEIVLQGQISEVDTGCVAVAVDAAIGTEGLLDSNGTLLLDPRTVGGQVVRGRLGQIYSYAHAFETGETVAVLAGTRSDMLNLELMPLQDSAVQVQWAGRQFQVPISTLSSLSCTETMRAKYDSDSVSIASGTTNVDDVAPFSEPSICTK